MPGSRQIVDIDGNTRYTMLYARYSLSLMLPFCLKLY
jgi:hypothetical protein